MSFTFGAYTACLQDRTLPEALDVLAGAGLTGAEINTGGFIPSPHAHVDALLASDRARRELLAQFEGRGMTLNGLTVSGNPLSPLPTEGVPHAHDLRRTIELAGELGVRDVVAMSGTPGSDPGARYPSWVVNPWNGIDLEVLEYQWSVAVPFWKEIDALARERDVRVALEMHPRNLVFTPLSFEQLLDRVEPTHLGVNLDPSHLFWQQMDPVACIERLGSHITHVHAKDTAVLPGAAVRGVLDPAFGPVPEDPAARTPTGVGHFCSTWPEDPAWRFVAIGEGHDVDYWAGVLRTLAAVDPDLAINIEHEDAAFDRVEGLERGAGALLAAAREAGL
ncbi:sugar phosphate isomerase [Brachybacterium sp. SGAir0954]|uniref:sugar phosphate isomerase/epimerase family protein n=1 Tax=Brachybacterium sp. SGAir0954 TaxID=2571029 RepID=UPI0010CCDB1C|nr:sugar phosphate isomerase/epimerase [Brachybacterium sp. SGAir0954]QCR52550.1 sugar phosphate isomerase [Brachybacterium sp. SGAir0954]